MHRQLPTAAKVVGIISVILGAVATYGVLYALAHNSIDLNIVAILLPAGVGLLFRSNPWRITARIVYGLMVILVPTCLLFVTVAGSNSGNITFNYYNNTGSPFANLLIVLPIAIYFYMIWAYVVLGRDGVRAACGGLIAGSTGTSSDHNWGS